jgi:hypothetical protein
MDGCLTCGCFNLGWPWKNALQEQCCKASIGGEKVIAMAYNAVWMMFQTKQSFTLWSF